MKYLLLMLLLTGCGKFKGDTGAPGPVGPEGPNGQNGTDATPVTVVPLCPGFTPTYHNVFPEYAVCINHVLYGVYSANGGFLAELPPGTYNSNGINATCTLIVHSNCKVTH